MVSSVKLRVELKSLKIPCSIGYLTRIQALLYPNHDSFRFQIRRMIRRAYFHIYGELFLEEVANIPDVSEFECTLNPAETHGDKIPRCPIPDVGEHFPYVPLFTAIYMIAGNVLLLNLLIAMFSKTYDKVEAESIDIANLLQYELIYGKILEFEKIFQMIIFRILLPTSHSTTVYIYSTHWTSCKSNLL